MRIADDLFGRLGGVGGKDSFGGTLAVGITSQDPADGQGVKTIAIPQRGSRADLQRPLSFTVPVQRELLPAGLRILYHLFQGRQALADDTGTANGVPGAFGRRFMEHRIQPASREASVTC
jgi:hypothetical protein